MPELAARPDRGFAGFEPAVCATGAGVAVWPTAVALELRGPRPQLDLLERSAARPWRRLSSHRALALADADARLAAAGQLADVAVTDVWPGLAALEVVGPNATAVAGLITPDPADPAPFAAPGHVGLLVAAERAQATRDRLVATGQALGAVAVSRQAVRLYLAARRRSFG